MVLPVEQYPAELEAAKQRIKRLKERHAVRCAQQVCVLCILRGQVHVGADFHLEPEDASSCLQETSSSQHVGQTGAEQNGGAQDPQERARSVVEQCVATQLLQPDLQLPVDSQAVAKKVICRAVVIPPLHHPHCVSGVPMCLSGEAWRRCLWCAQGTSGRPTPEDVWCFYVAPTAAAAWARLGVQ